MANLKQEIFKKSQKLHFRVFLGKNGHFWKLFGHSSQGEPNRKSIPGKIDVVFREELWKKIFGKKITHCSQDRRSSKIPLVFGHFWPQKWPKFTSLAILRAQENFFKKICAHYKPHRGLLGKKFLALKLLAWYSRWSALWVPVGSWVRERGWIK